MWLSLTAPVTLLSVRFTHQPLAPSPTWWVVWSKYRLHVPFGMVFTYTGVPPVSNVKLPCVVAC